MKKKWIYATFRKKMWLQKMLFMMSRIAFFILLGTMSLSANVYSQSEILDLKVKNATLAEVFKEITKKSGYDFLYNYDVVESQKNVSIRVTNMRLEEVLKELLGPRNLTYEFKEKLIVVRPVSVVGRDTVQQKPVVIKGTVRDEKGGVLPGVTVLIKGTKLGVATDNDGVFSNSLLLRRAFEGAVVEAARRAAANYTLAVPQFYGGRIQLLLPLCLTGDKPELALTIQREDGFYAARTCLTLDMAYNNARLICRPETSWIKR